MLPLYTISSEKTRNIHGIAVLIFEEWIWEFLVFLFAGLEGLTLLRPKSFGRNISIHLTTQPEFRELAPDLLHQVSLVFRL